MLKALYSSASGMAAQQRKIDTTSNNIANASTTGFKSYRAQFEELLVQQVQTGSGAPVEIGLGVRNASTQRQFSQGNLEQTENPLDLAIEGAGFFQVRKSNGEVAYTRSGTFTISAEGRMVTADGYELDPAVSFPPEITSVSIGRDGKIMATMPGDSEAIEMGEIGLANFTNPAGLKSLGHNLFAPTENSGQAAVGRPGENGLGEISQGFLEGSNVNVVEEMVNMIVSQRAYELNSKVIRTADEMLRSATNIR